MEKVNVTKRLIGRQDINWDTMGDGETFTFQTPEGTYYSLDKINATHIPIAGSVRTALNRMDVNSAFEEMLSRIKSVQQQGFLESDTEIVYGSTMKVAELNSAIEEVYKNLGGHTLTITFPEGVTRSLALPILLEGFYNGTIRIVGNDNVLKDEVLMDGLIVVRDCHASVEIDSVAFNHSVNPHALGVFNSSSVDCIECTFTSTGETSKSAALYESSNGYFENCILSGCTDPIVHSVLADSLNTAMEAVEEKLDSALADLADYGIGDSLKLATNVSADADQLVNTATYYFDKSIASSNFPRWDNEKHNGILSIWRFAGKVGLTDHVYVFQRFVREDNVVATRVFADGVWGRWTSGKVIDFTAGVTVTIRDSNGNTNYEAEFDGILVSPRNASKGQVYVEINGARVIDNYRHEAGSCGYSQFAIVFLGDVITAYGYTTCTLYPYVDRYLAEAKETSDD